MDASNQVLKVVKDRHVASVRAGVGGRPPLFVVAIFFLKSTYKKVDYQTVAPPPALFLGPSEKLK